MKLVIEGVERECEIQPAPKGIYAYLGKEELPAFPFFIVLAKATAKEEDFGNFLMCPVMSYNYGYETPYPAQILDTLYEKYLDDFIETYIEYGYSRTEAIDIVIEEMESHGVIIPRRVYKYCDELREKYKDEELAEDDENS